MTYAEKVAWLRRYQDSLRQEKELAEEVEQLRARAYRVTPALNDMPTAQGDGQALPRAIEQIMQAQQELQAQIARCDAVRREIIAALEQVPDPRDSEILRRRYLLGQRWEVISNQMSLDKRWVQRKHKSAVENLR